jgi:peptidoglycan-associated lipoprotein
MRSRMFSLLAAVALLAACESAPDTAATTTGGQMAAPPTTSGIRPGSQQDLVANVGDRVFFDFDRTDIKPEGRTVIERQANWLKQYPNVTVTVEGHCDERGTREYNLALGERRANAVRDYLSSRGIGADRLRTVSYGEERPKHDNAREETRRLNRRAALVVRLQR